MSNGKATEFQVEELRQQILRLGVGEVKVVESQHSFDGHELTEGSTPLDDFLAPETEIVIEGVDMTDDIEANQWFTTDLDVTATLLLLRQLPDKCGYIMFWRNVVDSDWSDALGQNTGVE